MGRIKTMLAKRISNQLIREHGEEFSADFDKNKVKVQELTDCESNKLRNIVAGYVTRLAKKAEN